MTDSVPQIVPGIGEGGRPEVLVGETGVPVTDIAALLAAGPGLIQPNGAAALAEAINHLAQGRNFSVIIDPTLYEAEYRAKLAAEDPAQPWRQEVPRVGDYGIPDFGEIAAPQLDGSKLVFFAADLLIGLPHRVEVDLEAAQPVADDDSYTALDLIPVEIAIPEEQPGEPSERIKSLQAAMATVPAER